MILHLMAKAICLQSTLAVDILVFNARPYHFERADMRKLLLLSLIAMLTIIPASKGQDSYFPPCSETEVDIVFDDIVSGYDALLEDIAVVETLDDLLGYSETQFEWRDNTWEKLPACAEAWAISLLLSQTVNDLVVWVAINTAGVPADENPYSEQIELAAWRMNELIAMIDNDDRTAMPNSGGLPPCSEAELEHHFSEMVSGYTNLLRLVSESGTVEGLLVYSNAQIAWREAFWLQLPACAELIELTWLMSQITGDRASTIALAFWGMPLDVNPYRKRLTIDNARMGELTAAILEVQTSVAEAPQQGSESLSCSESELRILASALSDFKLLDGSPVTTVDELLSFREEQIEQRKSSLSKFPFCAEAIELHLLITQLSNDFITRIALEERDTPDDDNPYLQRPSAQEQIGAAGLKLLRTLQANQAPADRKPPPACSAAELDILAGINNEFQAILRALNFSADVKILSIIESQLTWSENSLALLPACLEALELGLLMNEIISDYISLRAWSSLVFPGLTSLSDQASIKGVIHNIDRFADQAEKLGFAYVAED